jgi:hypothetical protein
MTTSKHKAQTIANDCEGMLAAMRRQTTTAGLKTSMGNFTKYADANGVCYAIRQHFNFAYAEIIDEIRGDEKPARVDLTRRMTGDRDRHDPETGEVA